MPTDDPEVLRISNEQDAWDALRSLLANRSRGRRVSLELVNTDWMKFHYTVTGEVFHQTITPSVMAGLIGFQSAFYRSAALILKDSADIRKLTHIEREQYEFVFSVKDGSSELDADLGKLVARVINGAVKKMGGTQITIVFVLFLLLFAGRAGFESYIQGNIDIKKQEIQAGHDSAQLSALTGLLSESAKENSSLLSQALRTSEQAREISEQAKDGYNSIIKHSERADSINVQGVDVPKPALEDLTAISRRPSKEVTERLNVTVKTIDRIDDDYFSIKLEKEDQSYISATISDPILVNRYIRILQNSLSKNTVISVRIDARQVGDDLLNAKIVRVSRKPD